MMQFYLNGKFYIVSYVYNIIELITYKKDFKRLQFFLKENL